MGLRIILFLSILVIILAATLVHIGCEEEEEGGSDDDGGGGSKSACCLTNGSCVMVPSYNSTHCSSANYQETGEISGEVLLKGEKCSSNPCGYSDDDDSYDDDDSSSNDDWYKYWNCIDDCKDDCGACCSSCGLDWTGQGYCIVPAGYTGTCDDKCADDYQDCFDWCVDMYG